MTADEKIQAAIDMAIRYGGFDGAHHKAWVIDQMLRILCGENYDRVIAESCEGEDGPNTFEHDIGVPP